MTEVKELLRQAKDADQKEAWAAVSKLVNMRPSNEEEAKARAYACVCLAEACYSRNKVGTAIDWWQEAVDCDPLNAQYRLSFVAHGLMPVSLYKQALNEINRSINLDPTNPKAYLLLGEIQMQLGNNEEAIKAYDKQIELDPDNPRAYFDRSNLACDMADWDKVKECVEKMRPGPETGNALHQLGLVAFRTGKHEEALKFWEEAFNYQLDDKAGAVWNHCMPLLALGRYREGWKGHEARGMMKSNPVLAYQMHRGRPDLAWNNEPPPARLHVSQEMGFGDAIAMARYLPILAEKGYDVRFEVMEPLQDLMRCLPDVKIVPRAPIYPDLIGVQEFDYHVPSLSLPRLFGTTTENIPNKPYLKANPLKVRPYRKRLGDGPNVGFCWSAGIRTEHGLWLSEYGKRKSIPAHKLNPIIDVLAGDCNMVSLQVGPEAANSPFVDLLGEKPTFGDTAALMECLDLVITADTCVSHLAGALGKHVWLMMHTEGSWHWMAERPGSPWNEKSPWYPTVRIFRAKKPHEWDDVIGRIAAEAKTYFQKAA